MINFSISVPSTSTSIWLALHFSLHSPTSHLRSPLLLLLLLLGSPFPSLCLRPTNHEPAYGIRHIGERIIRGCASAVLHVCNMIDLVHAKLTHTYAATRRLSGMPVGRATVMLSVFQICWSLLKKGGVLDSPENM